MHELAICQALISQLDAIAKDNNAQRITSITVGMGPLSGVEEQLLKNAYPLASAGTIADGAQLQIRSIPLRVHCTSCKQESEVKPNHLVCTQCGEWRTEVLSGDELLLIRVEMDRAEQTAAKVLH